MSNNIVQFNEEMIKGQIKELVRGGVEETLNKLLEAEAEKLTQAARYERKRPARATAAATMTGTLPPPPETSRSMCPGSRGISFETAIIERYRHRESSVEEALIEMYLAGVSVRRVGDITQVLWRSKVSASTISDLNKKSLCQYRSLAQPFSARRQVPVCVCGWHPPQTELGRRIRKCSCFGCDCYQ